MRFAHDPSDRELVSADVRLNLNRGLGHPDAYPFALSPAAVAKLKFVDDVVGRAKLGRTPHGGEGA